MPELPEVETIRFDLNKNLSGYTIIEILVKENKMVQPSVKTLKEQAEGIKILGFLRKAKLLIIKLEKPIFLLLHLKMTGRLLIRDSQDKKDEWDRIIFKLKRGKREKELRFTDQRKFGYVKVVTEEDLKGILAKYGPEPLKDLSLNYFKKILKEKNQAIKKVLMDQSLISGVGNIYANDALYLAKIHPEIPAKDLTPEQVKSLLKAIETVLKAGLKYRGASDNSYLDAFGKKGEYQKHFLVYGKKGEKCLVCGEKIKRYSLGGRGTFYCPHCQNFYKNKKYFQ